MSGTKYAIVGPSIDLTSADLSGADLTGKNVNNIDFTNADFTDTKTYRLIFDSSPTLSAIYNTVVIDSSKAIIGPNVDLSGQNLSGMNLTTLRG